jgi:hypothetical protein
MVCVVGGECAEPDSGPSSGAGAGLSSLRGPSRYAAGVGDGPKHQLPLHCLRYYTNLHCIQRKTSCYEQ